MRKEIYKGLNKLGEKVNLKNKDSIDLCLNYSEDVVALQNLIEQLEISVTYKGKHKSFERKEDNMYFDVEIKRGEKIINFEYNQSINFTEYFDIKENDISFSGQWFQRKYYNRNALINKIAKEKIKMYNDFLYSILCCIKTDGYVNDIFEDFCNEFGYNEDSRKDYELFLECSKQAKLIRKIFHSIELDCLPQ